MKRLLSAAFLLLYLYNYCGYFALSHILLIQARLESRAIISAPAATESLVRISAGDQIEWRNDCEILHAGQLYDIVSSERRGDSLYLYCRADKKEQAIESGISRHIANTGLPSQSPDTKSPKPILHDHNLPEQPVCPHPGITLAEFARIAPDRTASGHIRIQFPPPRQAALQG